MTEQVERKDRDSADRISTYLRPDDQRTVGMLVVVAAGLILVSTGWFAWRSGGVRLIDDPPVNHVTFEVDINSAEWTEFAALPNIGEKTARRIVEYRDTFGPFESVGSLGKVHGIGVRTIESIAPFIAPIPPTADYLADRMPGKIP